MKEVIKTIVIVILAGVAIFYGVKFNEVNQRMDVLNSKDSLQTVQVNKFDHRVHDLELMFEGRGKHIRNFQQSLKDFDQELDETYNKFNNKVDSLDYVFQAFKSQTQNSLEALKSSQTELNDRIYEVRKESRDRYQDLRQLLRRTTRKVSGIENDLENLQEQIDKMTSEED
jgi:chromosome segregation ATPase